MDFYDRVKDLAKQRNVTVRSLIESCGMNYDSYNSCKRYGNLPRSEESVKIAENLQTTVEYLVTGVETDTSRRQLLEVREHLLQIAESIK